MQTTPFDNKPVADLWDVCLWSAGRFRKFASYDRTHSRILSLKKPFTLVIEAHGIGYDIFCTQEAYEKAPSEGKEYQVFTRLIVREDSQTFMDLPQKMSGHFSIRLSASADRSKTGLAIVSALGASSLKEAIRTKDIIALTGIPESARRPQKDWLSNSAINY